MCVSCVRKAKRLGTNLRFGQIRALAHGLLNGRGIPLFVHAGNNYAVEAHVHRILSAQTNRKIYNRKHQ